MAKKVEVDFREVSAFITLSTPYRARYAYKYKGRYWATSWATSRGFLKDELIRAAIDGKAVIGFKAMYRSAVLGLDVDDSGKKLTVQALIPGSLQVFVAA